MSDEAVVPRRGIPPVWLIGIGVLQLALNVIYPGLGVLGVLALGVNAVRSLRGMRRVLIACAVASVFLFAIPLVDGLFGPGVGRVFGK